MRVVPERVARLSLAALRDLEEIWLYIARDDSDAADRFIDKLRDKCDLLARNSSVGRKREDLAPGLRSFSVGRYVIYYIIEDRGIGVARILSGYRDARGLLLPR